MEVRKMASLDFGRLTSVIGVGLFLGAITVSLILPLLVFITH